MLDLLFFGLGIGTVGAIAGFAVFRSFKLEDKMKVETSVIDMIISQGNFDMIKRVPDKKSSQIRN